MDSRRTTGMALPQVIVTPLLELAGRKISGGILQCAEHAIGSPQTHSEFREVANQSRQPDCLSAAKPPAAPPRRDIGHLI